MSGSGHGKFPKRGAAGKIYSARQSAPDGASVDLIQAVAMRAYDDGVHPEEIWNDIGESEGGI